MINKIPRQRIYKNEDIYVCIACDGMYTIEMIDEHLIKCSKMPEWEKQTSSKNKNKNKNKNKKWNKMMRNKRRSLEELDDVIDEILTQAPTEWFSEIDKIIKEQQLDEESEQDE